MDDSNPLKDSCYARCRRTDLSSSQLSRSTARGKELIYMKKYLDWYSHTDASPWKQINPYEANYYRVLCNTVATATLKGLVEGKSQSYFNEYQDVLTSVWNDYTYWGDSSRNEFWASGVPGYSCTIASSLLWNKLSPTSADSRSQSQKRADIKTKVLDLAAKIVTNQSASILQQKNIITRPQGNSQGEEAAWNGAFLSAVSQLVSGSSQSYLDEAKKLSLFSYAACADDATCALSDSYTIVNHAINPHPQYMLSVIEPISKLTIEV